MRIVHVITTLGVGGAEKHLLDLAGAQVDRGHFAAVVYLKGEGELAAAFEQRGVPVTKVELASLRGAYRTVRRLADVLRQQVPDLVHTHLLKADTVGTLAARRAAVRVVISSKHNDERALLRWPVSVVHGLLCRRVDRIIALSDHVASFTARHGRVSAERITRIYYGIDPDALAPRRERAEVRAQLGLRQDAPVLVCVGRLAPQKDHPTLLHALARLPAEVTLLVVGGDPFGDGARNLEDLAGRLELGDRARLLGMRHDVPDLLAASDLFVLPSRWEGLGLVFLESMAVGLPVVATAVSGVPEVVVDGQTGWLVPPGDPEVLAEAIGQALASPAERRARGEAGRRRVQEVFSLPRMIEETLQVYTEALAAGGRRE